MKFAELISPHLLLTAISQDDVADIVEACNDKITAYYLTTLPQPYTRENAVEFVKDSARRIENGDVLRWALRTRSENPAFVGVIELRKDHAFDSVGVWCMPAYRKRGFITEALKVVAQWSTAQKFTKNNEIYYACMEQNVASASVARKAGFKFLGIKQSTKPYLHRETGETYPYLYAIYAPNDPDQFSSWSAYL
jgi:RimJ/RimL family protein N-acetyltransferase